MMNEFIAGWTLSNHGGVGVLEMGDDYMKIQYYNDEPQTVEIEYDEDEAYITIGEITLYLSDCMKY